MDCRALCLSLAGWVGLPDKWIGQKCYEVIWLDAVWFKANLLVNISCLDRSLLRYALRCVVCLLILFVHGCRARVIYLESLR